MSIALFPLGSSRARRCLCLRAVRRYLENRAAADDIGRAGPDPNP